MNLKEVASRELTPTAPFDFDSTFHKPDHFPSNDTAWETGKKWQTVLWEGKKLGLTFENIGTRETPHIMLTVYSHETLEEVFVDSVAKELQYRFNLDLDLTSFYQQFKDDTVLGPLIKRWRGMRPGNSSSLYEYLIWEIQTTCRLLCVGGFVVETEK